MNVGRMYFYRKGSYQVWLELELELVLCPLDPFFVLIYEGLSKG